MQEQLLRRFSNLHRTYVQRVILLVLGLDLARLAVLFEFLEFLLHGLVLRVQELLQAFQRLVD